MSGQDGNTFDPFQSQHFEEEFDSATFIDEFLNNETGSLQYEPPNSHVLALATESEFAGQPDSQTQPAFEALGGIVSVESSNTPRVSETNETIVETDPHLVSHASMANLTSQFDNSLPNQQPTFGSDKDLAQFLAFSHPSTKSPAFHFETTPSILAGTEACVETPSQTDTQCEKVLFGPLKKAVTLIPPRKRARRGEACVNCSVNHVSCDGGTPCYRCIKLYSSKSLTSQLCLKADFMTIIESSSYFSSLYRIFEKRNVFKKSFWSSLASALSQHASTTTSNDSWLTVDSRKTTGENFTCRIRADKIQELSSAVLKQFSGRTNTITTTRLGASMARKVATHTKTKPIMHAVQLAGCCKSNQTTMWEEIMGLCTGIPTTLEIYKPHLTCDSTCKYSLKCLSFSHGNADSFFDMKVASIVQRYLEIALFKYLQHSINGRDGKSYDKTRADAMLMFHIIYTHKYSSSEQEIYTVDQSISDEIQPNRLFVRNILWRYCCIYASKLPSWSTFWDDVLQKYTSLRPPISFESIQGGLASFDMHREAHQTYSLIVFNSFQLNKMVATRELTNIHDAIISEDPKRSNGAFTQYFPLMASSQIYDYTFEILDQHNHTQQRDTVSLKSYPARTFLALASIGWTFPDSSPSSPKSSESDTFKSMDILSSSTYVQTQEYRRNLLIKAYETALEFSIKHDSDIKEAFMKPFSESFDSITEWHMVELLEKYLDVSRRWKELKDITGDAIILCGSPFVDAHLHFNIPKIAETGTEDDFKSLKNAILGDSSWIKDTCMKLQALFDSTGPVSHMIRASNKNREKGPTPLRDILGYFDPDWVIAGELRHMDVGLCARQVFDKISNHGSTEIDFSLFLHCLSCVQSNILCNMPRSEAEFNATSDVFLQELQRSAVPAGEKKMFYCRQILQSFWVTSGQL